MEYKDYTEEMIREFKGKDDSLLLDNSTIKLAEGDGWKAWIKTYGEIRGELTINGEEPISLYNDNINDYFKTNEEISQAEQDGRLTLNNNNWFDLEFISHDEYLDIVSDDAIAFSVSEGVETFKTYMADEDFVAELKQQVATREREQAERILFDRLVDWIINNLDVKSETDVPLMFEQPQQQVLTEMVMERVKNGNSL